MSKFTARWEVEDGYAGKSRPQETKIDTDDWMDQKEWDMLSDKEKREHIDSAVQEDYEQRISYAIDDYGI